ncbi:putative cyclin-D1-binding protein [Helianthus debilis subsp. tardiflorus]
MFLTYNLLNLNITGNNSQAQLSIPEAVGTVWKACSSLKETPRTNITAIRQSMIRIGSYINNVVLRKIKELKPASSCPSDEVSKPDDTNDSDLSCTEMKIIELVIEVVSGIVATIRETIHSITSLFKDTETDDERAQTMDPMESLLNVCTHMQSLVDDISSGVSPPQEISTIRGASEGIVGYVGKLQKQLELINGSSIAFVDAVNALKTSLKQLELELGCSDDDDDDDDDDADADDDADVDDELGSEMKNLELDSSCH